MRLAQSITGNHSLTSLIENRFMKICIEMFPFWSHKKKRTCSEQSDCRDNAVMK